MIRITLDLPAPAAEVVAYAELVADIAPEATIEDVDGGLVATVGEPQAQPEPEPVPAPKAGPKPKAKAKPKGAPAPRGGIRQAVLDVIELHDGHWEGSLAELGRKAHPANPASCVATIRLMIEDGSLVAERRGRSIVGIKTPTARRLAPVPEATQRPATPPPAPRPVNVPTSGLTPPAGGWG